MRISDWSSDVCSSDLHEEFVEVRSRDRQEAESLEQRVRCVARLLEHAAVECQPRKLAIEKAIAAALAEERIVVVIVEPGEVRGAVHRVSLGSAACSCRSEARRVGKGWGSTGR